MKAKHQFIYKNFEYTIVVENDTVIDVRTKNRHAVSYDKFYEISDAWLAANQELRQ
jgi:hypothetical protein